MFFSVEKDGLAIGLTFVFKLDGGNDSEKTSACKQVAVNVESEDHASKYFQVTEKLNNLKTMKYIIN